MDIQGELRVGYSDSASFTINLGQAGVGGGIRGGFLFGDGTNMKLANQQNGYLSFWTNNTERLVIGANGYLGIGTQNPQAPLHAVKSITTTNDLTMMHYYQPVANYKLDSAQRYWAIGPQHVDTVSLFSIRGGANGSSPSQLSSLFNIDPSGNVGIGSTNPYTRLHISKDITTDGDYSLMTFYQNTASSYNDWAIGPIISGSNQVFSIRGGYSDHPYGLISLFNINSNGCVGIGVTSTSYLLQLASDSAAKPSSSTWTVSSDERLKTDIVLADTSRCYDIVKSLPLKRYTWKDEVYTSDQVKDRSKLGWIAQDVEQVFPKAVNSKSFRYNQKYEDIVKEDGSIEKKLISEDVIEDCRDLNVDQLYAVMYGAIQQLIIDKESLVAEKQALSNKLDALITWASAQGFNS